MEGKADIQEKENAKTANEVACDDCGHRFYPAKLKKRRVEEIEITYFTCPSCSKEYRVCKTNSELRKMQQTIQNKLKRIEEIRAKQGIISKQRLKEYQKLVAKFKRKFDEFNDKKMMAQ